MSTLPEFIGKYRIKRMLGEGAMGIVYEAMDEAIERRVAIKTLHSHLLTKKDAKDFLERFKREARSAARCTHANIVTVLEYGEDADLPFIAMEFIDGFSLQQLLESKQKFTLSKVVTIVSQLLKAVHAAHKLGVIHRDIKTANIMLCRGGGQIKLADFGIAKMTETQSMTLTGGIVGTPKYMAPEQMFGLKADQPADLFAIAMVFAEMLAHTRPAPGVAYAKLPVIEGLPPFNKVNYSAHYPASLIPVLRKGLAPKAKDRFQTASEFATATKRALPTLKSGNSATTGGVAGSANGLHNDQILSQDLTTLSGILSNYIGPVATNVLKEYTSEHDTMTSLVTAISQEIPDAGQRTEFMQQWQRKMDARGLSREGSLGSSAPLGSTTRGSSINLDENTIQQISNDYVNYIGPFAHRLVDYYCGESTDKEQFLQSLAGEIPDQGSRDRFIRKWMSA